MLNKSFGVASYNRKLAKKHKKIDNPVKMKPIVDFTTETSKGQIISECPYEIIVSPKIPMKKISALVSKERSNQKLY